MPSVATLIGMALLCLHSAAAVTSVGTPTAIGGQFARCRAVLETKSEERTVEECLPICKAGEKNFDCRRECDKGDVFDEVVVVVREKKCTLEPRTRCSRREKPTCKQAICRTVDNPACAAAAGKGVCQGEKRCQMEKRKVCSKTMCSAHKASTKCEPGRKKVAKLVPITKCDSSSLTTAYGQRQRACKRVCTTSFKPRCRRTGGRDVLSCSVAPASRCTCERQIARSGRNRCQTSYRRILVTRTVMTCRQVPSVSEERDCPMDCRMTDARVCRDDESCGSCAKQSKMLTCNRECTDGGKQNCQSFFVPQCRVVPRKVRKAVKKEFCETICSSPSSSVSGPEEKCVKAEREEPGEISKGVRCRTRMVTVERQVPRVTC